MSTLERAIAIAAEAHAGQLDKGGLPYILHPIRVMLRCTSNPERIVAILHDVVEDTPWTMDQLRAVGFDETVLAGIDSVTHREAESYEAFVDRAGQDPLGRAVKIADLEDNSDMSRLPNPTAQDYTRQEKYLRALAVLR